jgi:Mce-associated membrane protein
MEEARHRVTSVAPVPREGRSIITRLRELVGLRTARRRAPATQAATEDEAASGTTASDVDLAVDTAVTGGGEPEAAVAEQDPPATGDDSAPDDDEFGEHDGESDSRDDEEARPRIRPATVCIATIVVSLVALSSWLGYSAYRSYQTDRRQAYFLAFGREAAVNLTTINHTEVDKDIQRILDSATGNFHDEFQDRAKPFVDYVKQSKSKSEGQVTEAGLQSVTSDAARVLVTVSVTTSVAAYPEPHLNRFRLRLDVMEVGDRAKVSRVEFL